MQDISVEELKERLDEGGAPNIIDVREAHEYEMDHLEGVPNMPMGTVPSRLDELNRDQELVVYCRSGGRSGQICNYLRSQGFENVRNLTGGMLAWKERIDPSFNVS